MASWVSHDIYPKLLLKLLSSAIAEGLCAWLLISLSSSSGFLSGIMQLGIRVKRAVPRVDGALKIAPAEIIYFEIKCLPERAERHV